MSYIIEQVHVLYEGKQIKLIAVMWQSNSNGWVRASHCINKVCNGYEWIKPNEILTDELIQKVAGYGMNVPDALKKKYFKGKFNWER